MATTQPSGFENLLALINANTNDLTLTAADFTLGSPTAVSSPESEAVNTSIVATAVAGSHYKDNVTLIYGRQTIAETVPSSAGSVFVWRAIGTSGFVTQLNTLLGSNFDVTDIDGDVDFTGASTSTTKLNIAAAATSLLVQGTSEVPVEIFPLEDTQQSAARLASYLSTTLPGYNL